MRVRLRRDDLYPADMDRLMLGLNHPEPLPPADALCARFDAATRGDAESKPATAESDVFGAPGFSRAAARRRFRFLPAEAVAHAGSSTRARPT